MNIVHENLFSGIHLADSWCFTLSLQVSEMQMFLKWKVAAVRHVKQQSGKGDVGRN